MPKRTIQDRTEGRPIFIIANRTSFTQRDYERFRIKHYIEAGFEVKLWDISHIFGATVASASTWDPKPEPAFELVRFTSKSAVREALADLDETCIVMAIFFYDLKSFWFFRALRRSRANFGVTAANAVPGISNKPQNRLKDVFMKSVAMLGRPMRALSFLFRRIHPGLFGVPPAHFVVLGGSRSIASAGTIVSPRTHRIWSHSLDYDRYLKTLGQPSDPDSKTIVFLDEFEPFHPDYDTLGIKRTVTEQNYYPALCKFFARVEKETGCKVVIAVHPKSNYDERPDYFEGRQRFAGRTEELVQESRFILAHVSTALNYAVLYEKPCVLMLTEEMLKSSLIMPLMQARAEWFHKTPIRIEREEEARHWQRELTVDRQVYKNFLESYIKTAASPQAFSWEIMAKEFLERKWRLNAPSKSAILASTNP